MQRKFLIGRYNRFGGDGGSIRNVTYEALK